MNARYRAAIILMIAVFALGEGMVMAQQDDVPILRPKSQITKPTSATVLVTCDLACNWTLDGEAKGRIEAGGSAKVKVELGQHIVIAVTEDGVDKVQQNSEIKANGQTIVSIGLKPVRDTRLKAEQEAQDKAAREQQENELREKERQKQEQLAHEEIVRQSEAFYKDKHYAEAIPLLYKLCNGGHVESCEILGSVYEEGKGVEKDYSRAFALYTKACNAANADGCNSLGVMYDIGRGVAKDDTKAVVLYIKACEAGSAEGCNDLGTMYLAGRGVGLNSSEINCEKWNYDQCSIGKDYPKALSLFSRACDAGSVDGCFYLGSMYSEGYGVTEDDSIALTLFTRACDTGSARGCYVAGIYYRAGNYVQKDSVKSRQFLSKGCSLGSQLACDALKKTR